MTRLALAEGALAELRKEFASAAETASAVEERTRDMEKQLAAAEERRAGECATLQESWTSFFFCVSEMTRCRAKAFEPGSSVHF